MSDPWEVDDHTFEQFAPASDADWDAAAPKATSEHERAIHRAKASNMLDEIVKEAPQQNFTEAAGAGARHWMHGLTMGGDDEAMRLLSSLLGNDGEATRQEYLKQLRWDEENYPYASQGGDLAATATQMLIPGLKGAKAAGYAPAIVKGAKLGAIGGGASGFLTATDEPGQGDSFGGRLAGGTVGAVLGGLLGGAGGAAGHGVVNGNWKSDKSVPFIPQGASNAVRGAVDSATNAASKHPAATYLSGGSYPLAEGAASLAKSAISGVKSSYNPVKLTSPFEALTPPSSLRSGLELDGAPAAKAEPQNNWTFGEPDPEPNRFQNDGNYKAEPAKDLASLQAELNNPETARWNAERDGPYESFLKTDKAKAFQPETGQSLPPEFDTGQSFSSPTETSLARPSRASPVQPTQPATPSGATGTNGAPPDPLWQPVSEQMPNGWNIEAKRPFPPDEPAGKWDSMPVDKLMREFPQGLPAEFKAQGIRPVDGEPGLYQGPDGTYYRPSSEMYDTGSTNNVGPKGKKGTNILPSPEDKTGAATPKSLSLTELRQDIQGIPDIDLSESPYSGNMSLIEPKPQTPTGLAVDLSGGNAGPRAGDYGVEMSYPPEYVPDLPEPKLQPITAKQQRKGVAAQEKVAPVGSTYDAKSLVPDQSMIDQMSPSYEAITPKSGTPQTRPTPYDGSHQIDTPPDLPTPTRQAPTANELYGAKGQRVKDAQVAEYLAGPEAEFYPAERGQSVDLDPNGQTPMSLDQMKMEIERFSEARKKASPKGEAEEESYNLRDSQRKRIEGHDRKAPKSKPKR